jgi:hypothetical protein
MPKQFEKCGLLQVLLLVCMLLLLLRLQRRLRLLRRRWAAWMET